MNDPADSASSVRSDRRIAVVRPALVADEKINHAMQLFDSILWAFKGTTRSTWTTVPPEAAEVIVVHQDDVNERIAWKVGAKRVVEIATREPSDPDLAPDLVYPFRAAQVLALLERLEVELESANDEVRKQPTDSDDSVDRNAHIGQEAADPWKFVEVLRTLREVQNSEGWLLARDGRLPCLWLRADGAKYFAEPSIVQAIRRGTVNLAGLNLLRGTPQPNHPATRSGTELSWFAGYHASEHLAPWLNPAARYRVTRWPNFGLIRPLPSNIRIAAALASAPMRLDEVASRAHVSIEEGTRVLNALAVAQIVEVADADTKLPVAPRSSAPRPRGGFAAFLSNVRKHLGLGT